VTNYECTIANFEYEAKKSEVIFTISANRFLRNMVRAIIGTILEVGLCKISTDKLIEIIDKSDRIYAGPSVPAHGLFLTRVEYPKNIFVYE
jgi:tRNA pseudouridine38-40 synthase